MKKITIIPEYLEAIGTYIIARAKSSLFSYREGELLNTNNDRSTSI